MQQVTINKSNEIIYEDDDFLTIIGEKKDNWYSLIPLISNGNILQFKRIGDLMDALNQDKELFIIRMHLKRIQNL